MIIEGLLSFLGDRLRAGLRPLGSMTLRTGLMNRVVVAVGGVDADVLGSKEGGAATFRRPSGINVDVELGAACPIARGWELIMDETLTGIVSMLEAGAWEGVEEAETA